MKTLTPILTLVVQFIVAVLLEVALLFIPLGSFGQLVVLFVGSTLAVWGVGILAARRGLAALGSREALVRLVTTAVGSVFGVWLITAVSQAGFVGMFQMPVMGAALGSYFALALPAD